MTRVFGWSISSTTLIPFADLMNHGMDTIDHNIVHMGYELDSNRKNEKYKLKKPKINLKSFLEDEKLDYGKKYDKNVLEGTFLKYDYSWKNKRKHYFDKLKEKYL
jgi:hypothetical protein